MRLLWRLEALWRLLAAISRGNIAAHPAVDTHQNVIVQERSDTTTSIS